MIKISICQQNALYATPPPRTRWRAKRRKQTLGSAYRASPVPPPPGAESLTPIPEQRSASREAETRLGQPIGIAAVANLIGCSPWTVRQTLIPQGLPVFRSAASGKLIFYTNQVVRWIERQQKGGL